MQTFTDFKKDFYSRVTDFTLFDCEDFNLLKVVLDGLKVNYTSKGKVKAHLFSASINWYLYRFVKRCLLNRKQKSDFQKFAKQHYLVSDIGRSVQTKENPVSFYFENIISTLGKKEVIHIIEGSIKKQIECDICFSEMRDSLFFQKLTQKQKQLRISLIQSFNKIKQQAIFNKSELENIQFAFHKFFTEYVAWSNLIEYFPALKTAYFICHYHKEGQILALKRKGIKCIELQHGLIMPQDIFYVFPEITKHILSKALFADKILVYGEYWKQILLKGHEYSENKIEEIGFYPYEIKTLKQKDISNNILITTQTYLHDYFIDFALRMEGYIINYNLPFKLLVKPHPSEKIEVYQIALQNSKVIKLINVSLPEAFSMANIHISIYSTALYDALRFNLKNFVFKVKPCEDYVDEILKSGIAEEIISIKSFFEELQTKKQKTVASEFYYSSFDKSKI